LLDSFLFEIDLFYYSFLFFFLENFIYFILYSFYCFWFYHVLADITDLPSAHPIHTSPSPQLAHLRIKRIPQSSHHFSQHTHAASETRLTILLSSPSSLFVLHFHLFNPKPPSDTSTCDLTSTRLSRCFMQPAARPSTHLHDITEPVCLFPWAKGQPMGRAALRRALLRIGLESSVLYTLLFALDLSVPVYGTLNLACQVGL
jgi:hypothetical protein